MTKPQPPDFKPSPSAAAGDLLSFVTCTHRMSYYEENILRSLQNSENIETIAIDTTIGSYSAPSALNEGLNKAKGQVAVCCHHDIIYPPNWTDTLRKRIAEIERNDKHWAVIGVLGIANSGSFVGSITDPNISTKLGRLPCKVQSLDEVCLIINMSSGLRFDEMIGSYHFYGSDICLQAAQKGLNCYAIDAPFTHISGGLRDDSFFATAELLKKKWSAVPEACPVLESTCGIFLLRKNVKGYFLLGVKKIKRAIKGRSHRYTQKLLKALNNKK